MSDTRSRSEIESALSGKQRLYKRKVSLQNEPDGFDDFELESRAPRRRQVIGGDLTGVSKRGRRTGILNKLSEVNITNWLAVSVVIAILIAFFWPHNSTESIREIAEQNIETEAETFYTESRIDEVEQAEPDLVSFGRDTDLGRANEFRTQEETQQQIEELLINAKQYIAKGQYISPEDNNALSSYQAVLSIDQSNSEAKDGINNLKDRFLLSGQAALKSDNEQQAASILASLNTIDPASREYTQLSNDLSQWRLDTQIADLLSKAASAKDDDNLILPANQSSLYFYRQALALDSNNDVATQGIESITDVYIDRANEALLSGDLEEATAHLASASVVDPDDPSVNIVRNMIATAEPIAAQTLANRQQTSDIILESIETDIEPVVEIEETPPPSQPFNQDRQISDNKTPQQQANEQAEFDQIYLTQGLEAYYQGDYDKAAALLQPLADKGVSRAQFRIGYMHYLGRGFTKNTLEADKILRAALPAIRKFANEGRSWAQSDLGSLYEDGLVLPRDYPEAIFWYRSAAEKGYPGAQTNLGFMYARGRGVTTSRNTAIEWFQRAAQQGDIVAQRNLESLGVN